MPIIRTEIYKILDGRWVGVVHLEAGGTIEITRPFYSQCDAFIRKHTRDARLTPPAGPWCDSFRKAIQDAHAKGYSAGVDVGRNSHD